MEPSPRTTKLMWAGRVASALAVLFLLFDSAGKLFALPPVIEGTARLGYPPSTLFGLGFTELVCTLLYVIPWTAPLGTILLTGFLGGAVATHVRIQDPLFSHVLFPGYVAALIWGGIVLRDVRLRALLPMRA